MSAEPESGLSLCSGGAGLQPLWAECPMPGLESGASSRRLNLWRSGPATALATCERQGSAIDPAHGGDLLASSFRPVRALESAPSGSFFLLASGGAGTGCAAEAPSSCLPDHRDLQQSDRAGSGASTPPSKSAWAELVQGRARHPGQHQAHPN
jgi:hypothetical protein